ncbi:phosphate acetyltransferase, partial [bacterium]|nr:phosphate acetyltransferase [candidate division CSSED10-310 bacterium]
TAPGVAKVSSCFMIVSPHAELGAGGVFFFADCGVQPEPGPRDLADIAVLTADTAVRLVGLIPMIAFLSFSTKGSAAHPSVDKMTQALAMARKLAPNLCMDGELQLDAAIVPAVAEKKAPGSPLDGNANILVFPDLNAANIGYKLAQRIGKAVALGPILQGFRRPVNDLSRGCSTEDIVNVAAITALQGRD